MPSQYAEYRDIIGGHEHGSIARLGEALRGTRVAMVNSTRDGGGVAEILQNMLPLLQELGLQPTWEVMEGNADFFTCTKTLHNALHGRPESLSEGMRRAYRGATEANARRLRAALQTDIVYIHDPQPAGLAEALRRPGQSWIFRCHIDVSSPFPEAWDFLRPMVEKYDASVFSHPSFCQKLPMPQFLIAPSIDPLSDKNKPLTAAFVGGILERYGLDPARPIVSQISRFDKLKDPLGVIAAYRLLKRSHPQVQLVLAGGAAGDDPESAHILPAVMEAASHDTDIHVLELPPFSDLDINALQRGSSVVLQKSLKEGFALTVTEALWKERPVVAMAVGGIPLQVLHGRTGWLAHSLEGTAYYLRRVLDYPEEAAVLGRRGREHVLRNFLITRHIRDYLSLFLCVQNPGANPLVLR